MQEVPAASFEQIKSYVIVAFASGYGFLISTYICARRIFGHPLWGFAALALAVFGVNAIMLEHHGHIYDFGALFLGTLLFILADKQNDALFAVVLAIGSLTKESLSLFILIYAAIGHGARPALEIARNLAIQGGVFILTYGYVTYEFADNPGTAMMNNIPLHWQYLLNHGTVTYLGIFLLFLVLLLYGFTQKPRNIQRAMAVLPFFVLLAIIGGEPGEFRIMFV